MTKTSKPVLMITNRTPPCAICLPSLIGYGKLKSVVRQYD